MSSSITVHSDDALETMAQRFAEPGELLADAQLELEDHMREHFSDESGPDGPWAQLSEKYGQWKEAHYPGMPILQAEGNLIGSIAGEVDGNTARAFTDDPVGMYHDEGTSRMPQRSYGYMTDEFMDKLEEKAAAYWGGD